MKTLKPFSYITPQAASEAASLLAKHKEQAKLIAGGTDLLVMMKDRVTTPKHIIDIKSISGLDYVKWDEKGGLSIGALTKISTVASSDVIKENLFVLYEAAKSLGTYQLRNMATIGGNICRSSPSADMIPPLLVLEARLRLSGSEKERMVLLENFITGPGENVLDKEILTEISVPSEKRPYGTAFGKLGRLSEDLAKVNCAVKIVMAGNECEDIKIALGAVAPTPVRARKVEQALVGKRISLEVIEDAVEKVAEDIAPIDDVRSSAEYRSYVSRILVKRVISEAMKRLEEKYG